MLTLCVSQIEGGGVLGDFFPLAVVLEMSLQIISGMTPSRNPSGRSPIVALPFLATILTT